jgi:hypothetical protein
MFNTGALFWKKTILLAASLLSQNYSRFKQINSRIVLQRI